MNVHLSHYPNSFIRHFAKNQQQSGSMTTNRYLGYTNDKTEVGNMVDELIEVVLADVDELEAYLGGWSVCKAIYIHYLSSFLVDVILKLPPSIPVIWVFWGDDGFQQIPGYLDDYCLYPQTKRYYDMHLRPKMKWCKNPIYLYKNYKAYKTSYPTTFHKNYLRAAERIDYFAHYLKEDYELLRQYAPLNARFLPFCYMSLEQLDIPASVGQHRHLLLGNSSAWTNNHLDLLSYLGDCDTNGIDQIIAPLSYSGTSAYIEVINQQGKQLLGEQWHPLLDFLPLDDYYQLLGQVSMAVIGTVRSQAAGNILSLLLQGTRVYMDTRNILYQYLCEIGVLVFDLKKDLIQHLEKQQTAPLNEAETQHNRQCLERIFSFQAMNKHYKQLLELPDPNALVEQ